MGRLPVIRRGAVLLVAAFLGWGTGAPPAWAHESLEASEPAADSVLAEAPQQVRLSFSADVVDAAPTVVLKDSGGAEVPAAEPVVEGPTVALPIAQPLADGTYAVEWRIVSSDGDPVSGGFAFTVEAPVPVTPAPVPTSAGRPPGPAPEAAGQTLTAVETGGDPAVRPWLVAGAVVLATVVAGLALWRRSRRGR